MHWPFPPDRRPSMASERTLERYVGQPFPAADYVLLSCFGVGLTGERTYEELRRALLQAGYTGPLLRHVIRVSPVIYRGASGSYRIKNFEE